MTIEKKATCIFQKKVSFLKSFSCNNTITCLKQNNRKEEKDAQNLKNLKNLSRIVLQTWRCHESGINTLWDSTHP